MGNAGTSMRYRGQIASVTSSISQGQPLPPGGAAGQLQQHSVQQSPHLVRPPIFTRLLSIVRSFGIRIWECLWLLPIPNVFAWFSSRKTDRIEGEEEEEVEEEGEDHLDKSGAELKEDKKPQQQVQSVQSHQQNQNNKKQGKTKGRTAVSRKKSNPNVLNNHTTAPTMI